MRSEAGRSPWYGRGMFRQPVLVALCALVLNLVPAPRVEADEPLATVGDFDREAYLGRWHQVALLPNWFQRKCVASTSAEYALLPNGNLRVTNRCQTATGETSVVGEARQHVEHPGNPAVLQVRFAPAWLGALPFVWGDYWVIATLGRYDAALVGSPDRKYLWVLSRTPGLPDAAYAQLVAVAKAEGFPVEQLRRE